MTIAAKVEAFAAETGADVEKVWEEFIAFCKDKKDTEPAKAEAAVPEAAPEVAPEVSAPTEAPTPETAPPASSEAPAASSEATPTV